jgi:rubrerythrin
MERDERLLLTELIQLENEAVRAYDEAIGETEHQEIHNQLSSFRDDHQRHLSYLQSALENRPWETGRKAS